KLPKEILKIEDPMQLVIDDLSKTLVEEIVTIKESAKSFSPAQYSDAKQEKGEIMRKLEDANRKIGAYQHSIEAARKEIGSAKKAIEQLGQASEFAKVLDKIRSIIFNRDGIVGM